MTSLSLELFVNDLEKSANFYQNILGFEITYRSENLERPYIHLIRDKAEIGLGLHSALEIDHPAKPVKEEKLGKGVQIILTVDQLNSVHDRIVEQNYPITTPITKKPWGLHDFRITDPDGHYIRITERR